MWCLWGSRSSLKNTFQFGGFQPSKYHNNNKLKKKCSWQSETDVPFSSLISRCPEHSKLLYTERKVGEICLNCAHTLSQSYVDLIFLLCHMEIYGHKQSDWAVATSQTAMIGGHWKTASSLVWVLNPKNIFRKYLDIFIYADINAPLPTDSSVVHACTDVPAGNTAYVGLWSRKKLLKTFQANYLSVNKMFLKIHEKSKGSFTFASHSCQITWGLLDFSCSGRRY